MPPTGLRKNGVYDVYFVNLSEAEDLSLFFTEVDHSLGLMPRRRADWAIAT